MTEPDPSTSAGAAREEVGAAVTRVSQAKARGPLNVIWVQIDDIGMEHCGDYSDCVDPAWDAADPYPPTPTLNRLASEGMRFRRAYSTPSCSPTKACSITGRQVKDHGVTKILQTGAVWRLPTTETTPAKIVTAKGLGISTIHVGKWHLSYDEDDTAVILSQGGFDRYIGALRNLDRGDNTGYGGESPPETGYYEYDSDTDVNTWRDQYNPDLERENLVGWLATAGEPFYVEWWMHAVHSPYHWPPVAFHTQGASPGVKAWLYYKAMIESMDTCLGDLLDWLDAHPAIKERTVVLVVGDNGAPSIMVDASYGGHNGDPPPDVYDPDNFKFQVKEGGVHIPMFAWGAGIQPGSVTDSITFCCDIQPTIADLLMAGYEDEEPSTLHGVSLVPLFTQPGMKIHDYVYTAEWGPEGSAITDADTVNIKIGVWAHASPYKLILTRDDNDSAWVEEFYELGTDPTNLTDLHEANPLDVNTSATTVAAYQALRTYIQGELGLSDWSSSVT